MHLLLRMYKSAVMYESLELLALADQNIIVVSLQNQKDGRERHNSDKGSSTPQGGSGKSSCHFYEK